VKVERIVNAVLERERPFFERLRTHVESGQLEIRYILGNHDRLLEHAPRARRRIWKAMTGEDRPVEFPRELEFPEHGVLAYHGHVADRINSSPDGSPTIGDAIGCELIVRFPQEVRKVADLAEFKEIDDIDDVRPIYAVPAWVRRQGAVRRDLLGPISATWNQLVEEFFANDFVKDWSADKRRFGLDVGKRLRLLLELSTKKIMARAHDQRLTRLYKLIQHNFDGHMARHGATELGRRRHLRYVVNGHSHFASMVPLGNMGGAPAAYFNTGTWRTVHQIGYDVGGRPSFLPYDAMTYLVFFPGDDRLERDYEWWTGAMVSRPGAAE
jgi:UDP-2,3-diacylglucosamine pyrophosphatase LpxH